MNTQRHCSLKTFHFSNQSSIWPDLRELWSYRDLVILFALRDVKVRYRQTLIGGTWALLQPLLLTLALSLPLSHISGITPPGTPYFVFAFAGLIPWLYFSTSVARCSESIVAHGDMLRKVYFPRILIPLSAILPAAMDSAVTIIILLPFLAWKGLLDSWRLLLIFPLALWAATLALAFGLWLATFNVLFRDVRHVTPFLLQILMFASPVFYSIELLPSYMRVGYLLNPLVGLIESVRAVLLGTPITSNAIPVSLVLTCILLFGGIWLFCRAEQLFADVV